MASDFNLLKEMQNLQPWLVRTTVDDESFAKILEHIDISITKDKEKRRPYQEEDVLVMILKGLRLYVPKTSSALASAAGYTFLWLRYVCITNRKLYRNVIAACFDKETILQSDEERREYIEGRLVGLGIPDSQLDDLYFILKGYIDTVFVIGELFLNISKPLLLMRRPEYATKEKRGLYETKRLELVTKVNSRFEDTENINEFLSVDEIADIVVRDFFSGKKITPEMENKHEEKQKDELKQNNNDQQYARVIKHGATVTNIAFKLGLYKFTDYAAMLIDRLDERIRPYLIALYEYARWAPETAEFRDKMTPHDEVVATNVNSISRNNEMKDEAIHRMKSISLYDGVIESFEEDGAPQVYEPPYGASYWLEEDELKRIREVEKSENILVWGVMRRFIKNIFSSENIAEDHLLYVSRSKDKWAEERERLLNGNPHVYTLRLGHLGSKDVSIYRSEGGTPLVQ